MLHSLRILGLHISQSKTMTVECFENMILLHCKTLNFHTIVLFLCDLNTILSKTMMFIAKFKYFFYKLSFIQSGQGHRRDLWY